MNNSSKITCKVFLRSISLWVPYLALIGSSAYYLLRLSGRQGDTVQYLSSVLKLGTLGLVFFSFFGYEIAAKLQRCAGLETLEPLRHAAEKLTLSQVFLGLCLLLVWLVPSFFCLLFQTYTLVEGQEIWFLHWSGALLLYCFLPAAIGLLGGISLSKHKRPLVYSLILLLAFLSNPGVQIAASRYTLTSSQATSVTLLTDWFRILEPTTEYVADAWYGIPQETCRWCLNLFWLFAAGTGVFFLLIRKLRGSVLYRIIWILLIVFLAGRYSVRNGDSFMIKDSRKNSWEMRDLSYYWNNGAGNHEDADFQVLSYDLELSLKDRLSMKAVLMLSETQNTKYIFTLYHDLKVKRVTAADGEVLAWERDGDYLDISVPTGTKTLILEYFGECGKYYSNRQACLLPGYLAYYPVPGHQPLWTRGDSNSNRVPYQSEVSSLYRLTIKGGPSRIFTNIPQIGPHSYEGEAESLSVFGGVIRTVKQDEIIVVCGIGEKKRFAFTYEELAASWKNKTESLGLEKELSWDGTLLYQLPFTVRMTGGDLEAAVATGSQLYLCDLNSTAEMAAGRLLISTIPSVTIAKQLVYTWLYDEMIISRLNFAGSQDILEGPPAYEAVALAKEKAPSDFEKEYELLIQWIEARTTLFAQLVDWKCQTLGREYVLTRMYQYLIDESVTTHSVDFMYELE